MCNHLNHSKPNKFLGQSRMDNEGIYIMEFKCGNCGKQFRTKNHIIEGLLDIQEEPDREPEYNYEG